MPEQSLTTQVTASTEAARPTPAPPFARNGVDPWAAIVLVFGGVIAVATLVSTILSIIDRVRGWRRQGEEHEEGELEKVKETVRALEITTRDFMPAREIKALVDSEKGHRLAGDEAASVLIAEDRRQIGGLERAQARLEAQFEGQAAGMARIEQSVERLGTRIDDKFDRLTAAMAKA